MLTNSDEAIKRTAGVPAGKIIGSGERGNHHPFSPVHFQLKRVLRLEWLGQTTASVLWIGSVLVYGIHSSGDWLQLVAALSWFVANMAAVVAPID